ncbi:hypothetical protein LCAUW4_0813 [Lacticaseibacillus casei UW4]|nr:hypothetical protein LCAUW4_0813 [Lacticaseibacillus casei UW4]
MRQFLTASAYGQQKRRFQTIYQPEIFFFYHDALRTPGI